MNFKNNIILENERVLLRPIELSDYDHLVKEATRHEDLLQYSKPEIHTAEKFQAYLQVLTNYRKNEERYPFIIYDKLLQAYAGSTSFLNIVARHKRLEIGGTWIGKRFHRTGLNSNCKFLLLQYAFEVLDFERVELRTDALNTASRKAIVKIGGIEEGILRSHFIMNDGRRRDTVYYGLLKKDWPDIKIEKFAHVANYHPS